MKIRSADFSDQLSLVPGQKWKMQRKNILLEFGMYC